MEYSRVSKFTKKEFGVCRKVYHKEYNHNAMGDGIFGNFVNEIKNRIDSIWDTF